MRKHWKKIVYSTLAFVLIGLIVVLDYADRHVIYSVNIPIEEWDMLYPDGLSIDRIQAFQNNFNNPKLSFPRVPTKEVILFPNQFVISRLNAHSFPEDKVTEIVEFFNNPDHFDWGETTWNIDEADYIFRFYDARGEVVGKIFVCDEGCGMTRAYPFSPNMKFGGFSESGKAAFQKIMEK
ncbi:MAG: hypothetical protein EP346_13655 [Bacteroidetes bacterium]|nr:MAG: hypothetical protein EP346_13655 [Bacteroidota bacterium]